MDANKRDLALPNLKKFTGDPPLRSPGPPTQIKNVPPPMELKHKTYAGAIVIPVIM